MSFGDVEKARRLAGPVTKAGILGTYLELCWLKKLDKEAPLLT